MKQLTLALLFSIAPVAVSAHSYYTDKTEHIEGERCCGLPALVILDAVQAQEATQATITISGETVSVEGWAFISTLAQEVFGDVFVEENRTITVTFERSDLSIAAWITLLAQVEITFVTVQATIDQNLDCAGAVVTLN